MTSKQMAAAFNEWMREYTEDPASFAHEFKTVGEFLSESSAGDEPSYGQCAVALLQRYASRLAAAA